MCNSHADDESVASTYSGTLEDDRDEITKIRKLISKQATYAAIWRTMVIFILQVTSTFVTVFTYLKLDTVNIQSFQKAVNSASHTIESSATLAVDKIFLTLADTDNLLSLYADASGSTFPNVTVPKFDQYLKNDLEFTAAEIILYAPFVQDIPSWEAYSYNQWMDHCFTEDAANGDFIYSDSLSCLDNPIGSDRGQGLHLLANETTVAPIWQVSPALGSSAINTDMLRLSKTATGLSRENSLPALGEIQDSNHGLGTWQPDYEAAPQQLATAFHPMKNGHGIVMAYFSWPSVIFTNLIDVDGFDVVVENSCGQTMTLEAPTRNTSNYTENSFDYEYFKAGFTLDADWRVDGCMYEFSIYPTLEFWKSFETNVPLVFAMIVAVTSLIMAIGFYGYDAFIQNIASTVILEAARSNCIISSLFPSNVRARLFGEAKDENGTPFHLLTGKQQLKNYLLGGDKSEQGLLNGKPIADLFPETTVLFADLVGFTAWSSVREPFQVFTLLETVYYAFDQLAKKRNIFKVETVGDCYVAVAGVPDPNPDHALHMALFARDCIETIPKVTKSLEVRLGPDTGDLTIRVGLHSGPVTAGVLRGERSRFQLFGDTMNTASRLESTGVKDRIHLSNETAQLLIKAGKEDWLVERIDKVIAKGKGELKTFFLKKSSEDSEQYSRLSSIGPVSDFGVNQSEMERAKKTNRLIEWNLEMLGNLLKQVIASRGSKSMAILPTNRLNLRIQSDSILDELQEVIELPAFSDSKTIEEPSNLPPLPDEVQEELRGFISGIAALYKANPFHSFEHATHVAMSVLKLLSRIIAPSDIKVDSETKIESTLHDHTYGITSDPLTQFACAFSALIHDVDHRGVSNSQLVDEDPELAAKYKGKSPAEQNSIEIAWDMLTHGPYKHLRSAIFSNADELQRFRQLVVNSVLATDIMDKDLKTLRNVRWDNAFAKNDDSRKNVNRKATIVIEHLIQASDVAHTMQHWHIFRKWNCRLFFEMKLAFLQGRATKDPAEFWYEGELGFFDFYVIPLTKKLKACGVFGVSSDEYLNYATLNRKEWEQKGRACIEEMNAEFATIMQGNRTLGLEADAESMI